MSASSALLVLHELAIQLQSNPEKADLAQDVVDIIETSMGYELLAVLAVTEPDKGLQPLALSKQGQDETFLKTDKSYVESRCQDPAVGLTNWVARTGQSVRIGDVENDRRYSGIRDGIRSELCVPLLVGEEVIGVLNTETTIRNAYTVTDERFLETAASHIALAIKYSRQQGFGSGHSKRPEGDAPVFATCSYCKSVRVDQDNWVQPDTFLLQKFGVWLSHGICPQCYDQAVTRDFKE